MRKFMTSHHLLRRGNGPRTKAGELLHCLEVPIGLRVSTMAEQAGKSHKPKGRNKDATGPNRSG